MPDGQEQMYKTKFLLIDDAHLLEVHNLQRKVNQAIKHPDPVLQLDAPWDTDKSDSFDYINVLYDEQEDLFKMWYVVVGVFPGEYWERGRKTAYATSKDGIHWEKPIMNLVEVNGSKENNYIIGEMLSLNYNIIIDPSDSPARRYKMTFTVESQESRWARFHTALGLAYSADGIHWEVPGHVNPILRGLSDDLWGFLYDPDRRVYQLYTRRVPNLPRDISLYESQDLVNWRDRGRVLVAPDEHDPPEMFNLHDLASPFLYEDVWLGMAGVMYFVPGAESYSVYNRPPEDSAFQDYGIKHTQLAYSRDGVTWSRPRDRSPVIPTGPSGAPDAGVIYPARNAPIVRDGETWMYYRASTYRHTIWSQDELMAKHGNDGRKLHCCMLARMPEDHWVSLDAGSQEGWFLTRPYPGVPSQSATCAPSQLLVNADAEGGKIEAEFVTPYGEPVEGFTRADCIGISANGKDQEIKWKSGMDPAGLADTHRGGLCIRFHLTNAKMYSYSYVEPDPDGAIARYWDSARWNEAILHRSGNWDRESNAPAGGLPQAPGTGWPSGRRYGPNPRADAKWS